MIFFNKSAWVVLPITLAIALCMVAELAASDEKLRILSWNISGDAFVVEQSDFRSLLRWGDPDVVLLDEVAPSADPSELTKCLTGLRPGNDNAWNVNFGTSGGRQRGVIASRARQEILPEFSAIVPYPDDGRQRVLALVSPEKRSRIGRSMNDGIPVNGAVILIGNHRLLVLIADLQCCGDGPESWEELRRRVEASEIRRLVGQILNRTTVDGIVFAGDFNLVESTFPMALLTGPYPLPHSGLIPAELYHPDGDTTWTWDGRGTPFPSDNTGLSTVRTMGTNDALWLHPGYRRASARSARTI